MEEKTAGQVIEVFQSDRKHTQESLRVFYLLGQFLEVKEGSSCGFHDYRDFHDKILLLTF